MQQQLQKNIRIRTEKEPVREYNDFQNLVDITKTSANTKFDSFLQIMNVCSSFIVKPLLFKHMSTSKQSSVDGRFIVTKDSNGEVLLKRYGYTIYKRDQSKYCRETACRNVLDHNVPPARSTDFPNYELKHKTFTWTIQTRHFIFEQKLPASNKKCRCNISPYK